MKDNIKKYSKKSIISVVGNGYIEAEANILEIMINVSKTTETIKQSQEEVNKIVNNILNILKENGIYKKNINTTSIKFEPDYKWENDSRVYKGQKVEQNLIIIFENLKNNINKVIKILDTITVNNNSIELDLRFGIKEDRNMVLKCRELAYQDGFEKAKKYAELAGLKIIKTLKISENESAFSYSRNNVDCIRVSESSSTQLPMGKVEKSMQLYMDFAAE
jgi:uncharacterized protein YggE